MLRKLSKIITKNFVTVVSRYDSISYDRRFMLERIATGIVWKKAWHKLLFVISNFAKEDLAERIDPAFQASARRMQLGKNVSDPTWETYNDLNRLIRIGYRDIHIAAMRDMVADNGLVIYDIEREQKHALGAWIIITAQAFTCILLTLEFWIKFEPSETFVIIIIQIAIMITTSFVVFLLLLIRGLSR